MLPELNIIPLIGVILAFLIGSIPTGYLLNKYFGHGDIRKVGSGNIGATNVLRHSGKLLGLLTLLIDFGKGFAALVYINYQFPDEIITIGSSVVLGHIFSPWLKFKGGKGVATSFGILFALDPRIGFSLLAIWLLVFIIFRVSATSALAAFFLLPFFVAFFLGDNFITILAVTNSLFIYLKHINGFAQLKN